MSEPITAYPLAWPSGWPRTKPGDVRHAQFRKQSAHWSDRELTVADGRKRVMDEIRAFTRTGRPWVIDPDDVVISTNLQTRNDGLPRSGQREPDDRGVAVYWINNKDERKCIAIDQYSSVADNLAAIAATLDAMRAIERHGGAQILDRAFTGFVALPAPIVAGTARPWREVLRASECPSGLRTVEAVRGRYRELAMEAHPDRGGSDTRMADLNRARDEAIQELS